MGVDVLIASPLASVVGSRKGADPSRPKL